MQVNLFALAETASVIGEMLPFRAMLAAVNSPYGVCENAREGLAERYLAMLAAGGSNSYDELLEPFGLDAKDAAFWSIGLSAIAGMIDELEAIG